MTLTQLKYIVETANAGTISRAAEKLYISQPSLTAAIRELEHEFGITIFQRTNKGILLTSEGEEFLGYARQVITQTSLMEERYSGVAPVRHQFCVSTQHYSFAVEAFVELLKTYGGETESGSQQRAVCTGGGRGTPQGHESHSGWRVQSLWFL